MTYAWLSIKKIFASYGLTVEKVDVLGFAFLYFTDP